MAFNLTRMTVYALISAMEEDLRNVIKAHMGELTIEDGSFNQELITKSKGRLEKDIGLLFGDIETTELIDYWDLGDTFQTINANPKKFPKHISNQVKSLTRKFEILVPIRNRVMHIRPLSFEDLPFVSELCEKLTTEDRTFWNATSETLTLLKDDPSYVLAMDIKAYDDDSSISHNLPLPDFDETGLIGRDEVVQQVKQLCLGSFPVISIVGEGGIGKTALALKVAYELLEEPDSPFDAIVWVTSKTTQITVNEIIDIKGAINDSLGVIQEISDNVIGKGASQDLSEINEYLSAFKIVLFIDNLETILDDNIRNFVGSLPNGSKIVITSRIGLGAFEYPIKLQGIEESYASQFLRSLAKLRNVNSLSKLDEKILRQYVNRMHLNPSYIKWFVSSIQAGAAPEVALQNSNLFLEFCMSNVYEYLSEDARNLTTALQCAPGYRDLPELSYLTGFESLRIQKAIQELMSTNMLTEASKVNGSSVKNTYQISELARAYLNKQHKPSQTFQKSIQQKRNKLNSLFEQQMSNRINNKYHMSNIKFRDKSDRIVVKMLHDAIKYLNDGKHDRAYEVLQEAHRLSPEYFEVARVFAYFYQKSGNWNDAREQYELAIVLSPDTPQLHYWFGKFLLHQEENVEDALTHFKIAYDLDSVAGYVAMSLARCYMFKHEFDKSRDVLKEIEKTISQTDEHLMKMFLDTGIQIYYRIADDLAGANEYVKALSSLCDMRKAFDLLPSHFKDKHMRQKLGKCRYTYSRVSRALSNPDYESDLAELKTWFENEAIDFS